MKCSYCGEEIEDGLEVCPYCNGEVGKEIKEPPVDKENNEAKATVKKVTPADKNDEPPTPKVAKVKAHGRGMLVGMGAVCVVMLVGLIVMSVLFIKTNNELAEAKDSVGRLEYQLAAAQSASSSGNGQVDTSALPPAPASYKGVVDGISWEAYKYKDKSCVMVVESQDEDCGFLELNLKFKDASGGTLGAKSEHASGLFKGQKETINVYDAGDFYDIEVSVKQKASDFIKPREVTETHTVNGKKIIVDLSNKGDSDIMTARASALFYKEGKVVDFQQAIVSSLKPGTSDAKEITTSVEYDRYDLFVTGSGY